MSESLNPGNLAPRKRSGTITFANQQSLPRLPIPSLEETCKFYLEIVEPLVSKEDFESAKLSVTDFLHKDGPILQDRLKDYDKFTSAGSYIEKYHNNEGYLKVDSNVVINSNPFFLFEDDPTPTRNDQLVRATSLVHSSLKFISTLKQDRMDPDTIKGTPLCMSQYKRMFGTARIAEEKQDSIKVDSKSGHVVVLCRGQSYVFQALWPDGTLAITEAELKDNLSAIIKDSNAVKDEDIHKTAVGVFSTEVRHKWAKIRSLLVENETNRDVLDVIDSALFIVCLDDESPDSVDDRVANMLHGTYRIQNDFQVGSCCNRWYDKLQMIICKNGAAGINFEHSAVDGLTVLRFASDVYADNIIKFAKSITKNTHGKDYLTDVLTAPYKKPNEATDNLDIRPKKMEMDLSVSLRKSLFFAETKMSDLIRRTETKTLEFKDYGKYFIVKNSTYF